MAGDDREACNDLVKHLLGDGRDGIMEGAPSSSPNVRTNTGSISDKIPQHTYVEGKCDCMVYYTERRQNCLTLGSRENIYQRIKLRSKAVASVVNFRAAQISFTSCVSSSSQLFLALPHLRQVDTTRPVPSLQTGWKVFNHP